MNLRLLPVLALVAACTPPCEDDLAAVVPTADFFADISESSGIQAGNYDPDPVAGTAINDHSRLAFGDLDGDGYDDIVMHSLFPNARNGVPFEHLVFRNNGDGTFEDISDFSGLRDVQAGFFAFADVDDDGDQDVFAGLDLDGYADFTNAIYLNDGAGSFTLIEDSGVEEVSGHYAAGASFADFDNDGDVDLYLAQGSTLAGIEDTIFYGNGDGTFEVGNLRNAPRQPGNGVVACDIDGDGDQDVLVSNYGVSVDNGHNQLWINEGDRKFSEAGVGWGFAAKVEGNRWREDTSFGEDREPDARKATAVGSNGFGIDCADISGDGRMDVFLATISHPDADYTRKWSDATMVLVQGEGELVDEAAARGLPFNEGDIDAAIVDFDNDGHLDLSLTRDTKYESRYEEEAQKSWLGLYRQAGGTFEDLGYFSGINDPDDDTWRKMKGGQNHAWSDIDHDGDMDLLVGGRDQGGGRPNFLFRNEVGQDNRWIALVVEGDGAVVHRDAFGTRATLTAGDRLMLREKRSGRGTYNSVDDRALHFGLAEVGCDWEVSVRWPDGTEVTLDARDLPENTRSKLSYPDVVEPID